MSMWTKEHPKAEGWYWFRDASDNLVIVEIVRDATGLWVQWLTKKGKIFSGSLGTKRGEWAGPIPLPTEAE